MDFSKKTAVIIILIAVLAVLTGCRTSQNTAKEVSSKDNGDKIIVFASVLPQADFVKRLGGDRVEVNVMMPPGINEHNYEPDSGQLKALSRADIYVKVGHLPFEETWMERFLAANKNMLVVDSSRSIELIDHNPHIWLSPRLVKLQAEGITSALIKLDPQNQNFYISQKEKFLRELDSLDQEITSILEDVKGKSMLVYHPAWGYFARDYGIKEIAIEVHGKEPGAGEMSRIIDYARKNNIKTIFASPQHSTRSAQAVAEDIGGKVVALDPLPLNYFANMREAAGVIAREIAN
ncbi:MAG: metal ABC transporter solute-binding protein, Zn/Mn family [Syntrophomonadaceae bacterium]|jgi:zinc transport system substrate-binding protein